MTQLAIQPPKCMADWLVYAKQISPRMKDCYKDVQLNLIKQGWGTVFDDEAELLPSAQSDLWIRQIMLVGDQQPCTYGRTVIPAETFHQYSSVFENLGNQMIGESFLYKNAQMVRSAFQYAVCDAAHPLYRSVSQALNDPLLGAAVWSRRSVFDLMGYPLLLTEIILPTIRPYPAAL